MEDIRSQSSNNIQTQEIWNIPEIDMELNKPNILYSTTDLKSSKHEPVYTDCKE